ncbi:hypothetical protein AGMMS50276_03610 [Synergistales bacterium]|nr:hypothetical protein AGMMS50276_03610 [Synergistales bacterium]
MTQVREMMMRHFGNHAYIIRIEAILASIERTIAAIAKENRGDDNVSRICAAIGAKTNAWKIAEDQLFNEIKALRMYYCEHVAINEPTLEEEFLQLMGEYGVECENRLGFAGGSASIREMEKEALRRVERWRTAANDMTAPPPFVQLARTAVQICERLLRHLRPLGGYEV